MAAPAAVIQARSGRAAAAVFHRATATRRRTIRRRIIRRWAPVAAMARSSARISTALGPITATVNGLRPERTVSIVEEAGRGRVLQVQAGTGYGAKSGVFLDNLVTPNNSHFGRAFIRVDQFPSAGGDHWVIVEATQNDAGERVRPVGGQFSRWAPGSDGPSAQDWTDWNQSNAATRAGTWECVEWQVNGANGGNDLVLWVNGAEVLPIDRANFRLPAVNLLWLGWVVFQTGQPPTHEVRFDDVVISSERVGCN
jgi:hypothetical protein